ncbi:unnamed protein product, partial [Amoebophrya sp. A120]
NELFFFCSCRTWRRDLTKDGVSFFALRICISAS